MQLDILFRVEFFIVFINIVYWHCFEVLVYASIYSFLLKLYLMLRYYIFWDIRNDAVYIGQKANTTNTSVLFEEISPGSSGVNKFLSNGGRVIILEIVIFVNVIFN